jgi:hypothetical protein
MVLLMHVFGCLVKTTVAFGQASRGKEFLSETYNHFEGGVLFTDIDSGLTVLWQASFKHGRVYKENLGFFVEGGLLIFPNRHNTRHSSSFSELYTFAKDGKLFVAYNGSDLRVLGIIHTHPDKGEIQEPTSGNDYQFSYLGIYNYILSTHNLFIAQKNSYGVEAFERLGARNNYSSIPIINVKADEILIASN